MIQSIISTPATKNIMRGYQLPQLRQYTAKQTSYYKPHVQNIQLPTVTNTYIAKTKPIQPPKLPRPSYRPALGLLSVYNKPKAQFSIGEHLRFKDKRTGKECQVIAENSIPNTHKYFFSEIHNSEKPLLCLDMDQTLLYSQVGFHKPFDVQFSVSQGTVKVNYSTIYRPYLQQFLRDMRQHYDLMIFTSAGQLYADALIDLFDTEKLIQYRVYQQHCTPIIENGMQFFVKDLSKTGQSLNNVLLVDDNMKSFLFQKANAVPIKAFDGNPNDVELRKLAERLNRVYTAWRQNNSMIASLKMEP